MDRTYYVYLMTNASRVVLYTGMTNDLARRMWEHQTGACPGFTKRFKVNRLVYCESYGYVHDAIAREKEIKGWTRAKKNTLVETGNPQWNDLAVTYFGAQSEVRGPSLRSG